MTAEARKFESLSPQGQEALEQGFNPRSMSEEDYAKWQTITKRTPEGHKLDKDEVAEAKDTVAEAEDEGEDE